MPPTPPPKSLGATPPRLPPEVWEGVILQLHPSEIPQLRLVNRDLRHLIENSPELQYRLDLYAAGLEDGSRDTQLCLSERRKRLEQYLSGWENLGRAQRSHVSIAEDYEAYDLIHTCGGVVAHIRKVPACGIHFVRLPSPSKGITTKQWTVRDLPAQDFALKMEPELDLLLIIENVADRPSALHFLRMSDGKPHPEAFSSIVTPKSLQFYPDDAPCDVLLVQAGARILLVAYNETDDAWGIIFDWRTGERGKPWRPPYAINGMLPALIDDHRILVTLYDEDTDTLLLSLLDTMSTPGDAQFLTGVAFELSQDASFCVWDRSSLARVPRHMASFCLDHSRRKPMIIPVTLPREDKRMADLYVITSDRVCALAEKFKGSARIPWVEWKGSLTFVGGSLPRSPYAYSVRGLNLFVDVTSSVMPDGDPGIALRVYRCSPRVRRTPLGVAGEAGLPYDSIVLSFDDQEYMNSEMAPEINYCEDNIIIHTTTEGAEETKLHFLSF